MSQPDPAFTEVSPDGMAEMLGVAGVDGAWLSEAGGTSHVLVPTEARLEELQPNLRAVAKLAVRAGGISLCPFRRVDDANLHVRVFVPAAGIGEDPGTGSAAGPIGLLARRLWNTSPNLTLRQGDEIGRPCRIQVTTEPGHVKVSGFVTASRVAGCSRSIVDLLVSRASVLPEWLLPSAKTTVRLGSHHDVCARITFTPALAAGTQKSSTEVIP
jgi:PhzF family phenazine biosynthesis protein